MRRPPNFDGDDFQGYIFGKHGALSMDVRAVQSLYEFHHWATDRALDALAPVSAAQLDAKWGGSFGTGRALVRHVVGVERLWCDRWNGQSPKSLPDFPATFSARDFRGEWEKVKADQQRFVSALTPQRLSADLSYVNMKGESSTYALAEILQHCVNHGTYHRGQLTHLLRDLGHAAVSTDYLIFIQERQRR